MGAEVFVSYSSLDRDRVMPVVESLRGNGISVWVDEGNIHAADLWSEQIVQAIADCRVMVVMLSQNSTDSHNVVKELMLASEQKKALLPVYLEPADVPAKLQYQLAGIQHLELYGENEEQVLEDLVNGLAKRGISREGESVSPQSTTVKRHDRPRPNPAASPQSNNLAKLTIGVLALSVFVLLGLLFFQSPSGESVQSIDRDRGGVGKRMHVKIPIPEEYPMAKPTDMPFGAPFPLLEISHDGQILVYTCVVEGERYICMRKLAEDKFTLLPQTKGGFLPFFDPTNKWLAFFVGDKLVKMELNGGVMKTICGTRNPSGGTWGADGLIYFADGEGSTLRKVNADGGKPETIGWNGHGGLFPKVANNGKGLVFMGDEFDWQRVNPVYLPTGVGEVNITELNDGEHATWVGRDSIVFLDGNYLQVQKIDPVSLDLKTSPITIPGSRVRGGRGVYSQYSISQNGVLTFIEGSPMNQMTMMELDASGEVSKLYHETAFYGTFRISPDGKYIAIEEKESGYYNIKIFDVERKQFSSVTKEIPNYRPVWANSSKAIYYSSFRNNKPEIYRYDLTTRAEENLNLSKDTARMNVEDVTKDDQKLILFWRFKGESRSYFYSYDLAGDGVPKQLSENDHFEWGFTLSSDNKWVAYTSEKDMKRGYEIYINRFPEMNNEIRISVGGGEEPKWLPDGSGVYYRNGSQLMKVSLDLESEPKVGKPELFFEGDYVNVWGPSHDIFPDGRILLLELEEWVQPTEIDVIINALDVKP